MIWKIENKMTREIKTITEAAAVEILSRYNHDEKKFIINYRTGGIINTPFVRLWTVK